MLPGHIPPFDQSRLNPKGWFLSPPNPKWLTLVRFLRPRGSLQLTLPRARVPSRPGWQGYRLLDAGKAAVPGQGVGDVRRRPSEKMVFFVCLCVCVWVCADFHWQAVFCKPANPHPKRQMESKSQILGRKAWSPLGCVAFSRIPDFSGCFNGKGFPDLDTPPSTRAKKSSCVAGRLSPRCGRSACGRRSS